MSTKNPVSEDSMWSYPVGQGDGFVWGGNYPVRPGDIEALKDEKGSHAGIDKRSLVGRWHPKWTSAWYMTVDPAQCPGGEGSPYFEGTQYCGMGVNFTREDIWYFTKKMEMVCGIPPNCGAYHQVYDGDGFTNHEGPEPGSEAAAKLGKTAYHWDDEYKFYYPGPEAPVPWWTD